MSKYKKIMIQRGIMQKDVLQAVRKDDPRVDNPLLSKIVNDVCLPTPRTLKGICKALSCAPLDIYTPDEIDLAPRPVDAAHTSETTAQGGGMSTTAEAAKKRARRRDNNLYNLTVEIPRDVADRVFSKEALRLLGFLSKSDLIRHVVAEYDLKLAEIKKKKAADAGTSDGGKD